MDALPASNTTRWLPLGDACRLLDVSQATLRQWADCGHLRVYRTPGGHRRFLQDDVETLINGDFLGPEPGREAGLEQSVLRRIRRRLHHQSMDRQAWYQRVEAENRVRLRLFGRRLLSLLAQQGPVRPRRRQVLTEAYLLGREYAAEMAGRSAPLKETVEAFFFFRTMVLDLAEPRSWNRILELADQALMGVIESYQERMPQPEPAGAAR